MESVISLGIYLVEAEYLVKITIPTKIGDKVIFITYEVDKPTPIQQAKQTLITGMTKVQTYNPIRHPFIRNLR